jgi:hypothetical protein
MITARGWAHGDLRLPQLPPLCEKTFGAAEAVRTLGEGGDTFVNNPRHAVTPPVEQYSPDQNRPRRPSFFRLETIARFRAKP